jgi:hypothetical protein
MFQIAVGVSQRLFKELTSLTSRCRIVQTK